MLKRNLTDADVRIIKAIVQNELMAFRRLLDDRLHDMRGMIASTVATLDEGIEYMDNLVQRAKDVAERSNTVTASFQAWWNEVKGRLDQAVNQQDIDAVRQALDQIDQNTTQFGQAIAANTAAASEGQGGGSAPAPSNG